MRRPPQQSGLDGLLRGIGELVDQLNALAGDAKTSSGEINLDRLRPGSKLVYGVSIRTAADGRPRAEPFGNLRPTRDGAMVQPAREPLVDVFDEGSTVLVVAELPGVAEAEIVVELAGDLLRVETHGEWRYARELLIEQAIEPQTLAWSYRNGILEIRIGKVHA
jgi:HSP20 family protein